MLIDRFRRLWPFSFVVGVVTFGLSILPPHVLRTGALLAAAGGCFLLVTVMVIAVPWERPAGLLMAMVVVFCVGVALLRASGWRGQRRVRPAVAAPDRLAGAVRHVIRLGLTIGAVFATYVIPILAIGGAPYPPANGGERLHADRWGHRRDRPAADHRQRPHVRTARRHRQRRRADRAAQPAAWDRLATAAMGDGAAVTVGLIEIDHFGNLDQANGHLDADRVLQLLAESASHAPTR